VNPCFFEDLFVSAALTFPISGILNATSALLPRQANKQDRIAGHYYRLETSATRTTCALSCSIDELNAPAARPAAKKLASILETFESAETKTVLRKCLEATQCAHQALDKKKKSANLGLTALVLNWLSDLQSGKIPSKWVLSAANVGHNKIFHWISAKRILVDLTPNNYAAPTEEGYCIGYGAQPTRIFQYTKLISRLIEDETDIIIVLSYQVYHHFDPETLGKVPKDFYDQASSWKSSKIKKWDKISYNDPIRQKIRTNAIQEVLSHTTNIGSRNVVQIISQAVQSTLNRGHKSEPKKGILSSKELVSSSPNTTYVFLTKV